MIIKTNNGGVVNMKININKKDLEVILEIMYTAWDMAKEDLQDREAKKIARIRDEVLLKQYDEQCK